MARLLPPLVVLWLAFAVVGGIVFLPQHTGLDADRAHDAGLGLCAATAAAIFAAVARRPRWPAPVRCERRSSPPVRHHAAGRAVPRAPAVPLRRTLQVFLN